MDQIIIDNLEVFAHHGVFAEENVLGQKFLVSAVLDTDTREAGLTDDLSKSTSYADVCELIVSQMQSVNYKLIERTAEVIAKKILLTFPLIKNVTIEVKKPWAPILRHVDTCAVRISRGWHKAYIGVGSNMGDRKAYLELAKKRLIEHESMRNLRMAPVIETEPYGYTDQDVFLNSVFELETLLSPKELLHELWRIEQEANRIREIHWGPRTLDLDVLLYDHLVTEDPELIIPHPDMQNRQFVLEPLIKLNPYGLHPLLHKRYIDLFHDLSQEK